MVDTVPTDLHGHSLASDGRTTPEDYVKFRARRGYDVIALTDHDTFAGVRRAARATAATRMQLIPAMEVTAFIHFATDRAEQVHILAYYPPSILDGDGLERTAMHARAGRVHDRWRAFVLEWIASLPADDQQALDGDGELRHRRGAEFPGLQTIHARIVERARHRLDEFRAHHVRFWTEGATLFGWTPEQLIDAVRADGALDVVAHPNRVRDKQRMQQVLDYASGVEVYTSRHAPTVAARFRAYAERTGKHWTASSDDHQNGTYVRPPEGTPRATLDRICAGA